MFVCVIIYLIIHLRDTMRFTKFQKQYYAHSIQRQIRYLRQPRTIQRKFKTYFFHRA